MVEGCISSAAPTFVLSTIRRGRLKSRVKSLEALVGVRDEQLEKLKAHAAALADLAAQKDRLLADLSAQAMQRRLEIAALERGVQEESHACEAMLNQLTNSKSWKLTAPARATASALTWWRQDVANRAAARRASGWAPAGSSRCISSRESRWQFHKHRRRPAIQCSARVGRHTAGLGRGILRCAGDWRAAASGLLHG